MNKVKVLLKCIKYSIKRVNEVKEILLKAKKRDLLIFVLELSLLIFTIALAFY